MTIDEFQKAELRIAKVLAAGRVEGSEKLIRLDVQLDNATRQLVAGIGKAYAPEALIGREIVIVANLDPRVFTIKKADEATGTPAVTLESQGMLLAAHGEDGSPILLMPDREAPAGSEIS
jgi:methionine--tRNA ligase beta chain